MTTLPFKSTDLDASPTQYALTLGDAERIATAVDVELAPSTRQVYASAWRLWERWCQTRGIAALPALPEALAAFLAERAEAGLTVRLSMATAPASPIDTIKRAWLTRPNTPSCERVRRGLRRIMGVAPRRQAHPLTVAELARIVSAIGTRARKSSSSPSASG